MGRYLDLADEALAAAHSPGNPPLGYEKNELNEKRSAQKPNEPPDTPEDDILAEAQRIAANEPNLSDDEYQALIRAIQTRRMRERGEVPSHYTEVTVCAHCGPIPIFSGVAERVVFCPWCFNRVAGLPVPRPQQ